MNLKFQVDLFVEIVLLVIRNIEQVLNKRKTIKLRKNSLNWVDIGQYVIRKIVNNNSHS